MTTTTTDVLSAGSFDESTGSGVVPVPAPSPVPGSAGAGAAASPDGSADAGPRARWRLPAASARQRIVGWVLLLVAVALAVTVVETRQVLRAEVEAEVSRGLAVDQAEFTELATRGVDPVTGEGFAAVDAVLYVALQRQVPDPDETYLAYVDGEVYQYSGYPGAVDTAAALAADPDLTARAAGVDAVTDGTVGTPAGEAVWRAVPIRVEGDPSSGVFLIVDVADRERAAVDRLVRSITLVALVGLLLTGLLAWIVAGRILAPVRMLTDTARQISDSDLSRRITVTGRDELAALAHTVNGMLDRLERAFAAQRQLIDDVGHELRTPITIVRGHLELSAYEDPEAYAQTVALVTDELDRMNRMVDDLLILATADSPTFVRPAAVDLGDLCDDVHARVRALGDRAWVQEARPDAVVVLDRHRIVQALVQLAQNAVQHTAPGDRIGLGAGITGGEVRLWVADQGPGIAAADHETIFHRFARGDRQPRGTGAGLGLAIVRAIAVAHGGRVTLDSTPGAGARFTLTLPVGSPVPPAPPDDVVPAVDGERP